MKLGPKNQFLCLIPPPLEPPPQEREEQTRETTAVQSWSLLQPLTGTCLYVRPSSRAASTLCR
jgi:protein OS-9